MKNFWVSDTGLGRDIFIFTAKDRDELEKFFIIQHNIDVEDAIKYEGRSFYKKTKTFKECKFFIHSEATDEETKNSDLRFSVSEQLERINYDYNLKNFSVEELIEQSFHGLESLIRNEE
jgi:hypothetical protein